MDHLVLDTDGTCDRRTDRLDWASVLGPGERQRVRLDPLYQSTAWVNPAGLVSQNIVASCLLVVAGGPPMPCRGRVVLTGWAPRLLTSGVCGLGRYGDQLVDLHRNVLRALTNEDLEQIPYLYADLWAASVRRTAETIHGTLLPDLAAPTGGVR